MIEYLLTRDETEIRTIVAREIVESGVRGPFLDMDSGALDLNSGLQPAAREPEHPTTDAVGRG